ncbi:hypothetical protein HJG54_00185 [Leptolyngbya sp. NK1-12]|uniref:Calcium-binding protein n=1 Tax=Leptolyngbya sp. NK1-12 TaxID=2547451 RepID=A0AA97AJ79_9CYAN|nr:hypothetical protein HJG54_00185 [Leptolyngbya sp. NK1-12]
MTLRGTKGANRLQGTDDSDVLIGRAGNDVLIGLDCRDRLDGGTGADRLNGGLGADILVGGAGADRFIYSGADQASAFENSLAANPDQIVKFRFSQGDKFQLDFDDNLNSSDRPRSLFNAGRVKGRTLEQAAKSAYRDKDQATENAQKLLANQAVFFNWRGGTYLSVNDRSQEFAANQDLLINVTGIQFKPGDTRNGNLNVSNYFA